MSRLQESMRVGDALERKDLGDDGPDRAIPQQAG
jgi:hypothetical protein